MGIIVGFFSYGEVFNINRSRELKKNNNVTRRCLYNRLTLLHIIMVKTNYRDIQGKKNQCQLQTLEIKIIENRHSRERQMYISDIPMC